MKQYLAVLALALALSGCNGGNTTGTEASSAQTEEEKASSATGRLRKKEKRMQPLRCRERCPWK